MTVYLKYGNYTSGIVQWSESESFSTLSFYETVETDRINQRGLNGIEYNHIKSSRSIWKITISANELVDSTKFAFIVALYKADAWKFSLDNWMSESIVNLKEAGEMPLEFIENHKLLREITINLIQKKPEGLV